MGTVVPEVATRNALASLIAPVAIELLLNIANNPEAIAATRKILGIEESPAMDVDDGDALVTKAALARRLSCSTSTVDRLVVEGMPVAAHVGDSRRFDLDACKGWLAARGKKATRASKTADISVDDVIGGSGLRAVK